MFSRAKSLHIHFQRLQEQYDLQTKKSPPSINELKGFKNELIYLAKNIEFKKTRNKFKSKLKSDVLKINTSNKIIVAADITNNMYKMSYENCGKLLSESITQKYMKRETPNGS